MLTSNINSYASPFNGNGNTFLRMYSTQPQGLPYPWLFAHRENCKAAVHAFTIYTAEDGQKYVHLLITKRPPFGGQLSIELPAGLWGDSDSKENALNAANREVREETGFTVKKSKLLAENFFATSGGMTTEQKVYALTQVQGKPNKVQYDENEVSIIMGKLNVPLSTFVDHTQFIKWLSEMNKQGYIIGNEVIAARGLLPIRGGTLDLKG